MNEGRRRSPFYLISTFSLVSGSLSVHFQHICSPRNVASMLNFTSSTARAVFEIRRGYGNAIRISKNCPRRLPMYTRAVLPSLLT